MTTIAIKDLLESVDLDRQAMLAISGGARTSGRQGFPGRTLSPSARIINYPGKPLADASGRPAGNKAFTFK